MYDFLIVGAGLTGTVLARELTDAGKKCLVIDRRDHIAGNCYTQNISGINVHKYGAHIFHTDDEQVWNYVGRFAKFNNYINSPIAIFHDEIYNLPFNMNTFAKMWNVATPAQAREIIEKQKAQAAVEGEPENLEEQALSLVGKDIFEKLIKEYTEKQWGRSCKELPADIIRRLPVRYTYDNNYFNHRFQGIPEGGYTAMVEKMLEGIEVKTGVSFSQIDLFGFKHVVYTGPVDESFDYRLGQLEWRSVRFETELLEGESNWQGNAVVNYTSHDVPYTRIIEQNNALYAEYAKLAESEEKVTFAGRLGTYKYYDMAPCIRAALDLAEKLLQKQEQK